MIKGQCHLEQAQRIIPKTMKLVLNFKSNLGTYGHDLLAYERDARGANLHTGVNLLLGANCAHEHEDNFIPTDIKTDNK